MLIRSKLLLFPVVLGLVASTLVSLIVYSTFLINNRIVVQRELNQIVKSIFQLNLITNDYIRENSERAIVQWNAQHAQLSEMMASLTVFTVEEQARVNKAREEIVVARTLFAEIMAARAGKAEEAEARLTGQLLIIMQSLVDSILEVSRLVDEDRVFVRQINDRTIVLLSIGSSVILVGLAWWIRNSITRPLGLLQEGARRLSEGSFEYRVPVTTQDEFKDVTTRFNEMAEKLAGLYGRLEARVKERTHELAKFQQAVASSTDGVVITDHEFNVVYVNPAFEKLGGVVAEQVIGRNANAFLASDKVSQELNRKLVETVTVGRAFVTDKMLLAGNDLPVRLSIYPVLENGEPVFYVALVQDVSQLKAIDKAKTEFVSLASHQLRTPLSAINWYAEMLLAGDAGNLNAEQQQYVSEIYAGNQRMVDLVNALLDVSRIELGTFTIEPVSTDILKLIRSVLDELKSQIDDKKLHVSEHYDDLPQIPLDPKLMRMVIQNLLSNAVKYTSGEGAIEVSLEKQKDSFVFSVADSGMGIPKSQQDKIFSKLFRADNVQQADAEGTGLGLYIVKSIIDQSGGRVWFESEENKGATFYVQLPLVGMSKKVGTRQLGS